jgi:DNA polymerase I-like protein with 3'-5' exonuclease and polymerase domains
MSEPDSDALNSLLSRERIPSLLGSKELIDLTQVMEADLINTAMLQLDRIFRRRNMKARIVMMIHDAIRIEAPAEEEEARRLMDEVMSKAGRPFLEMQADFSD